VALLWWARPLGLIHEPIMYLYTHPLVWFAPLVAFSVVLAIGLGIAYARKRRREAAEGESEEDDLLHILPRGLYEAARNISVGRTYYGRRRERPIWAIPALAAFGVALVTSIAAMIASPILTGRAIYEHYSFGTADGLPEVGQVRVMPKQVAEQLASAGWNSPTEKLVDGHIIRTPEGNLAWSFEQAPSTFIRQWTQKAAGAKDDAPADHRADHKHAVVLDREPAFAACELLRRSEPIGLPLVRLEELRQAHRDHPPVAVVDQRAEDAVARVPASVRARHDQGEPPLAAVLETL